ncbi:unnamed protein product [Auanema sp. JU1783]|nr:unnamed protein product [Auanema sp. JU1783]
MVHYEDFEQVGVADIPGLIEDAHKNEGLGISFLRHIERCRCFFYVIDFTLNEYKEQLDALQFELEQYRKGLVNRPSCVVINKIDLDQNNIDRSVVEKMFPGLPCFFVSAKYGEGLTELLTYLRSIHDLETK